MKKIVLMFMAVSLLLTGCSDEGKKNASYSKENTTSAMETLTTESVTNVTVQPTEQKQYETQSTLEGSTYEVEPDNPVNDSVSDSNSPNISQSMPENTMIPAGEQTIAGGENTMVSSDELPVVGGEDKTVPENSDNKSSVTNNPSSEKKPQTTTTVSILDEGHQTVTTSKKSGGVIELSIIPVE